MPREAEPSLNERAFILEALKENIRLDGRALDAFRDVQISFGEAHGVADVSVGKTRILARTTASIAAPFPDRKFDGIYTLNVELSAMATPSYEPNRSSDPSPHLTHTLELSLRRSTALNTESLCLLAGHSVWSLATTLHVISHDGSLLSTAHLAVIASLAHFRIPSTEVKGGVLTVYSPVEREPVPLELLHWPLCVTFAVFKEGVDGEEGREKMLVDATLREEQVAEGEVCVVANKGGEVCVISKRGGVPTEAVGLLGCVDAAVRKVGVLDGVVREALENEEKRRDAGGWMEELRAENER